MFVCVCVCARTGDTLRPPCCLLASTFILFLEAPRCLSRPPHTAPSPPQHTPLYICSYCVPPFSCLFFFSLSLSSAPPASRCVCLCVCVCPMGVFVCACMSDLLMQHGGDTDVRTCMYAFVSQVHREPHILPHPLASSLAARGRGSQCTKSRITSEGVRVSVHSGTTPPHELMRGSRARAREKERLKDGADGGGGGEGGFYRKAKRGEMPAGVRATPAVAADRTSQVRGHI